MRMIAAPALFAAGIAACAGFTSPAQARTLHRHDGNLHHHHKQFGHRGYGHRHATPDYAVAAPGTLPCNPLRCAQGPNTTDARTWGGAQSFGANRDRGSDSMGLGIRSGMLVAKANEIVSSCRSTVISGFRPGARVAGSGRPSLHASGRAVDIRGNPGCIYAHLQGWPGGYSTDYGAVKHVHISLGGREDGLRFAHYSGQGSRHASHARYAMR